MRFFSRDEGMSYPRRAPLPSPSTNLRHVLVPIAESPRRCCTNSKRRLSLSQHPAAAATPLQRNASVWGHRSCIGHSRRCTDNAFKSRTSAGALCRSSHNGQNQHSPLRHHRAGRCSQGLPQELGQSFISRPRAQFISIVACAALTYARTPVARALHFDRMLSLVYKPCTFSDPFESPFLLLRLSVIVSGPAVPISSSRCFLC